MNERRWFGSFSTVERCDGDATGDEEERGREGGEKKISLSICQKFFARGRGERERGNRVIRLLKKKSE